MQNQFTTPPEEWRPVASHEGWYEVSNLGRVRRAKPSRGTRRDYVIATSVYGKYRRAQLWRRGKAELHSVHKLVAEAFIGLCPEGKQVNHKNGSRFDNQPENLEYITEADNNRHAITSGLNDQRGERNARSRLAAADVIAIKRSRLPTEHLSAAYGVSCVQIRHIRSGYAWSHLNGQ